MKKGQIQAIGNFLQFYDTDLNYIKMFHDYKENRISRTDYIKKEIGTFYSFIIEFRIARNFKQGAVDRLLDLTLDWTKSIKSDNVDLFAQMLAKTNLTRGITTTSLASKVLFLNNPWTIIPMDSQTRKAFGQKENKYSIYKTNLDKYRQTDKAIIKECLQYTKPLTAFVDKNYYNKIKDIDIICENRMIDKLLWTTGK